MKKSTNTIKLANFLKNGASFKCLVPDGCDGHCCKGEGSIYIFPEDITRFLDFFNLDLKTFMEKHVKIETGPCIILDTSNFVPFLTLKEKEDGSCKFLGKNGLCEVYPARPFQCRSYPFWDLNVKTEKRWNDLMETCPGASKNHDESSNYYFSPREIKKFLKKERELDELWEKGMIQFKGDYMAFLKKTLPS
ncbi:MAG: YkgJ family cysteine cluster protein [Promethearchaeota archaeon]